MQKNFGELLTSSPEDTHASLFPMPGDEKARKMTAISGRRCLGLSKASGPLGSLEKMLLGTSIWASTTCFLTWKPKGTPQGRISYQLVPSMPGTDETEFSLLPTPTAQDNNQVRGQGKATGKRGTTLGGYARMWPTPKSSPSGPDYARINRQESGGDDLATAVARTMWATPSSRDWKDTPGMATKAVNPDGSERKREDQLARQVYSAGDTSGQLNPEWVEWLMGYPIGWTELKHSETP